MKKIVLIFIIFIFTAGSGFAELSPDERLLRHSILYQVGGNYLQNALYDGKVLRWNKGYFPVKVFVERNLDVPNYYFYSSMGAVSAWQKELFGIVKIAFVADIDKADITVTLADRGEKPRRGALREGELFELGYTRPIVHGKTLERMEIKIYKNDARGDYYKPNLVYNTVLHEFAHALGVIGHTTISKSIMCGVLSSSFENSPADILKEDKNTIKLLYMTTPDITNGDITKDTNTISADLVMGTLDERIEYSIKNQTREAKELYKDAYSMLRLVFLFNQRKDYQSMAHYLELAEQYAKTDEDYKGIYLGYSSYYFHTGHPFKGIWFYIKAHWM